MPGSPLLGSPLNRVERVVHHCDRLEAYRLLDEGVDAAERGEEGVMNEGSLTETDSLELLKRQALDGRLSKDPGEVTAVKAAAVELGPGILKQVSEKKAMFEHCATNN